MTGAPDAQRYQQANLIRAARGSVYFFGGTDIRTGSKVEYLFFKEGITGTEWSYVMLDGTRRYLKIVTRPVQVRVPAGTFTGCIHYMDSLNGTFVVGKDVIGSRRRRCPGRGCREDDRVPPDRQPQGSANVRAQKLLNSIDGSSTLARARPSSTAESWGISASSNWHGRTPAICRTA